jgi:hypothetical protein
LAENAAVQFAAAEAKERTLVEEASRIVSDFLDLKISGA